ncbi:WUSCHEL-related homeobox 8-like isoform X3 [Glycine soja]|uniref:WUSCHEL-related homeobox 13 isoform E n=1 Tax=Glycine soja TaxID=3848 RepID=A0A445LLL3_GLYSO|nr:WUSCHEL-related homeobox 8-like isoform X3 [Glycine soja]XP_040867730.1 WUSCHEL-related homeobox 8 isoform X3 [Glycine max]RZC24159.1 WUSCHEL-related homeobox 13 isoform E [Glycine soja]
MVNAMEWQKQRCWQPNRNAEMMCVKVMTDEQLEILRKQIAVYATICEQLIEMHKNISAHQDLAGIRLGNMYCDPLLGSGGLKIASRQRWTPTAMQLQILERIFDQGIGTPTKEKIKEITNELSQHGQISETNVYNWFQNRRARSKRKQQNVAPSANAESEVETEVDSKDKKTKPDEFQAPPSVSAGPADNLGFQNHDSLQYLNPESNKPDSVFPSDGTRNFHHVPAFDGLLSNSRSNYLTGKLETPENYELYQPAVLCSLGQPPICPHIPDVTPAVKKQNDQRRAI